MVIFDQEDLIRQDAEKMRRKQYVYANDNEEPTKEKTFFSSKRKEKKPKLKKARKVAKTFLDITSIRDIAENGAFILENGFMDMEQIQNSDLKYVSEGEAETLIDRLSTFFKLYKYDFIFMGMNYPTYTSSQQQYWHTILKKKRKEFGNDYFLIPSIKQKIQKLIDVEKEDSDQEYYIIYFAVDEKDYKEKRKLIRQHLNVKRESISIDKKMDILFKIYNQNSKIMNR
ncbi:hypothetical protein HB837_09700 [Listeria innocua]|uniref:hypothetical protein n=1 Tax=Listeria innocua TaxID=1642 RepID=UPI001627DF30|nr:hypothetical protein [Listeria innocua]MBC1339579.1 hypothetical protein [Listeria innocua]MBC1352722.1 hypothetical protein [Listeria innocua]